MASRLRFDALPPHALRTSLWRLHFTLSSEDCKSEVKLLTRYAMIGNIRYAMHGSTNSIARQVATVASRLRFDALPPHALRTSLGMLHFTLLPEDCKGEVKLLMRCAMIRNISYAMHGSTNSVARQVATVASRLRFDALPPHTLRTSPWMLHFALSSMTARTKSSCRCAAQLLEISDI